MNVYKPCNNFVSLKSVKALVHVLNGIFAITKWFRAVGHWLNQWSTEFPLLQNMTRHTPSSTLLNIRFYKCFKALGHRLKSIFAFTKCVKVLGHQSLLNWILTTIYSSISYTWFMSINIQFLVTCKLWYTSVTSRKLRHVSMKFKFNDSPFLNYNLFM